MSNKKCIAPKKSKTIQNNQNNNCDTKGTIAPGGVGQLGAICINSYY